MDQSEDKKAQEDLINVYKYLTDGVKKMKLISGILSDRIRGNGHKMKYGEFCSNRRKYNSCEGAEALECVFQSGCRISILGGIQNPVEKFSVAERDLSRQVDSPLATSDLY